MSSILSFINNPHFPLDIFLEAAARLAFQRFEGEQISHLITKRPLCPRKFLLATYARFVAVMAEKGDCILQSGLSDKKFSMSP